MCSSSFDGVTCQNLLAASFAVNRSGSQLEDALASVYSPSPTVLPAITLPSYTAGSYWGPRHRNTSPNLTRTTHTFLTPTARARIPRRVQLVRLPAGSVDERLPGGRQAARGSRATTTTAPQTAAAEDRSRSQASDRAPCRPSDRHRRHCWRVHKSNGQITVEDDVRKTTASRRSTT